MKRRSIIRFALIILTLFIIGAVALPHLRTLYPFRARHPVWFDFVVWSGEIAFERVPKEIHSRLHALLPPEKEYEPEWQGDPSAATVVRYDVQHAKWEQMLEWPSHLLYDVVLAGGITAIWNLWKRRQTPPNHGVVRTR